MLTTGSSFATPAAIRDTAAAPAVAQAAPPAHKRGFSFGDFLDIVNPLQHLPVIGTLYRKLTGDEIGTPEKLVGDALFGGPWGLVSSLADTAFQSATGKNFGDTVLALITGDHDDKPAVEVASAQPVTTRTPEAAIAPSSSRADPDAARRALFAYRQSLSRTHPSAFGAY